LPKSTDLLGLGQEQMEAECEKIPGPIAAESTPKRS